MGPIARPVGGPEPAARENRRPLARSGGERRGHVPGRPPARSAVPGRLRRASASPSASGASPTLRPLLLAHGGFDFVGTYDVFAPLLADGGWRVVAWDQRGHGDSEHAALYSWAGRPPRRHGRARARSATSGRCRSSATPRAAASCSTWPRPCPTGSATSSTSTGSRPAATSPTARTDERTRMLSTELAELARPPPGGATKQRRPGTLDELADRRRRMNPRLSMDWLRYLVTVGGRQDERRLALEDRPGAAHGRLRPVAARVVADPPARPAHAVLRDPGRHARGHGLGHPARGPRAVAARRRRDRAWADSGHFVHIEFPERAAERVLDFLARHP